MRPGIFALLSLVAALSLAGCDRQKAPEPQADAPGLPGPDAASGRLDRSHAGTPAPDVAFADPEGEETSLAEFEGRPVLVNLWATWCAPCIVEMPSLDALAAREEGLTVLALSQDIAGREAVDRFFAEREFRELEPYLDDEMAFMTALGLGTLPTTILYDAQGREVWRMTGMADWESERAARLLREAEPG